MSKKMKLSKMFKSPLYELILVIICLLNLFTSLILHNLHYSSKGERNSDFIWLLV